MVARSVIIVEKRQNNFRRSRTVWTALITDSGQRFETRFQLYRAVWSGSFFTSKVEEVVCLGI